MSSAAEAELRALFLNAKTAVLTRITLTEMGHPQPRTSIQTDNSTAYGLINNKIIAKATKLVDMSFHWLCCRDSQGQFRYYWRPRTQNLGNYWTKHHPGSHHQNFRQQIITSKKWLQASRKTNTANKWMDALRKTTLDKWKNASRKTMLDKYTKIAKLSNVATMARVC